MIENVQSASFEMAIGSSGTIESIEQMINHTAATSTGSQTLSNSNTLHEREFTIGDLGMVVKKVILKTFSNLLFASITTSFADFLET